MGFNESLADGQSQAGTPGMLLATIACPVEPLEHVWQFVWDDARLDAWLTNPQQVIPGAVMAYRQAKPETRAMIIAYLKELN